MIKPEIGKIYTLYDCLARPTFIRNIPKASCTESCLGNDEIIFVIKNLPDFADACYTATCLLMKNLKIVNLIFAKERLKKIPFEKV